MPHTGDCSPLLRTVQEQSCGSARFSSEIDFCARAILIACDVTVTQGGRPSLRGTLSASELRTLEETGRHVLSELAAAVGVGRGTAIAEDEPGRGGVPTVEEPARWSPTLPGHIAPAAGRRGAPARWPGGGRWREYRHRRHGWELELAGFALYLGLGRGHRRQVVTATDSFDKSLAIEKGMKANGATDEEIQKAIEFHNPYNVYVATQNEILGNTYTEYWAKVLW
jgi:hypothetical protein